MKDSLYIRLARIEKQMEGNEFFEGGISYCFGVDEVQVSPDNCKPLKDVLLSLEAMTPSDELVLKRILNAKDDIEAICAEWHFEDDFRKQLIAIVEDLDACYSICDDDAFISWGNVYSVFRLLEKDGEYALAEFYKSD